MGLCGPTQVNEMIEVPNLTIFDSFTIYIQPTLYPLDLIGLHLDLIGSINRQFNLGSLNSTYTSIHS